MAKTEPKTTSKPAKIDARTISLFSRPSDFSWIIDIDGDCWLVDSGKSGLVLCGYSKLSVDPAAYDKRRDLCKGLVRVLSENSRETCVLGFGTWSGKALNRRVEIKAQHRPTKSAKWVSGHHDDHWIDVDAVLRVDGADVVEIDVYLPAVDNRVGPKTIDIFHHGDPVKSLELTRGQVQCIAVPTASTGENSAELLIESEYAEDLQGTGDERLLGCVITGLRLIDAAVKVDDE